MLIGQLLIGSLIIAIYANAGGKEETELAARMWD